MCVSNKFSVFENVCDSVRSVCLHTSSIETFESSRTKNCQSDKMSATCLNTHIKSFCKQNKKDNSNIRSSKPLSYQSKDHFQNEDYKQTINYDDLQLGLSDKGLNFGHLNIQGICGKEMSKFSEIKAILSCNKNLHILGLSETKLKDHKLNSMFQIEGFQDPYRKDNDLNGGGGIIVYVRNGINAKRREDLEINNLSCIWLEISQNKGKSFLIGNMYRPPDSKIEYCDRFEDMIEHVSEEGKEIILLGDFNKNLSVDNLDREWQNLTLSLGLTQLISQPTRVTPNSKTLIDHIYTSHEENIASVSVSKQTISDHYAVFGNRKQNHVVHKYSHQTITYRSFKHFDQQEFINDLSQIPWEILDSFDDVSECVQVWNLLFLEVVNKHAPLKQHRVKKGHQPEWLSPEIIDNIKERNKCKLNGDQDGYVFFRNKVSSMIKTAKNNMYRAKIEKGKDDPRTIWKIFKEFGASRKRATSEMINGLKENGQHISDDKEMANLFNKYFVNIAAQLKGPVEKPDFKHIKEFVDSKVPTNESFSIPNINNAFVLNFLKSLDVTKATGLDCIGPRILKIAPEILSPSISYIINKSLTSGSFPQPWKEAKISPIFKNGSKDDVNNYRPISILATLSKIIEKWIQKHFMSFLNSHKLLHENQSGFREGHSTESALISMIDSWLKAINDGKYVGCLMIDFRKAFDLVDHSLLLQKLELYKCDENSVSWFTSYLSNRTQRVSMNSKCSQSEPIRYGVPQGSILGPLMFLLFINDLPLVLKDAVTSTDLYADDTTVYDIQSNMQTLQQNLQKSLSLLNTWCKQNGMVINTDKTKVMLITSRQKRQSLQHDNLILKMNEVDLKLSSNEKILGINIDENLVWNGHYQYISKKIASSLWLLSQIKSFLSVDDKLLFYNAYIRPHLEYCSVIWGNSTNVNIQKMTKLQRRACKLILGDEYTHLDEARDNLKILSFDEIVFLNKAKIMYKVANNIAPSYLINLFQMRSASNDTITSLRSVTNKNFLIPKPKLNLFKNSLSYSGAIIWNSIPLEIKTSKSLDSFVNKCKAWMKQG